jgi:hypothetical protein
MSVMAPTLYAYLVNGVFVSCAACTGNPATCVDPRPQCTHLNQGWPCTASITPITCLPSDDVDAVKANVTALLLSVEGLAAMPAPLNHGAVVALAMEWVALDAKVMSPQAAQHGSYTLLTWSSLCDIGDYKANFYVLEPPATCGSVSYPSALFPSAASPV